MWKVSKVVRNVQLSGIRRVLMWARESGRKDLIYLNMGEPDFSTPFHIKEAAIEAIKEGFTHYTSIQGIPELREAIAEKLKRENRLDVDPDKEILVTAGTQAAIYAIMRAMLDEGDEVIIPDPCYPPYDIAIRLAGGIPHPVPLKEENNFVYDVKDIELAINKRTKLILIISPNNPTGCVIPKENLEEISAVAEKHDLIIVSDELYEKIIYDDAKHVSVGSLPGMKERTITVNGFSKTYAMTGWRVGYIASTPELITNITKVHHTMNVCASSISQRAALAAIRGPQDCVEYMVKKYDERRKLVMKYFDRWMNVRYIQPKGAFYFFPNIGDTKMGSEEFTRMLITQQGVVLVPGLSFGKRSDKYVRISYATSIEILQEALERIQNFLDQSV